MYWNKKNKTPICSSGHCMQKSNSISKTAGHKYILHVSVTRLWNHFMRTLYFKKAERCQISGALRQRPHPEKSYRLPNKRGQMQPQRPPVKTRALETNESLCGSVQRGKKWKRCFCQVTSNTQGHWYFCQIPDASPERLPLPVFFNLQLSETPSSNHSASPWVSLVWNMSVPS